MNGAMRRFGLSNALLAAGLLSGAGQAQAPLAQSPQNGIWQTGGVNLSHSGSANRAPATSAKPAHQSTEASRWSAGRGGFGAQNTMPLTIRGASNRGASNKMGNTVAPSSGSSTWTTGRGSFGQAEQPDGIWRDRAGLRNPGGGAMSKPANGLYPPSSSPNFMSAPSAFTHRPKSNRSARAALRRPLASAHARPAGPDILSQTSKHSQSNTLRHTGNGPSPRGLGNRTSPQSRLSTNARAGMKPSPSSSKAQAPE